MLLKIYNKNNNFEKTTLFLKNNTFFKNNSFLKTTHKKKSFYYGIGPVYTWRTLTGVKLNNNKLNPVLESRNFLAV